MGERPYDGLMRGQIVGILLGLAGAALAAFEPMLDLRSIDEAIALGQTRIERERARFHTPYRFTVNRAPIDSIEVITPFRRIVLAAEERVRIGDRLFGQRQALEVLRRAEGVLDISVEATFHPHNVYIRVPDYRVVLRGASGGVVEPEDIDRYPRYGFRVEGGPRFGAPSAGGGLGLAQPLTGGTVVAHFGPRAVDTKGRYDVVVVEGEHELARVTVDLSALR
jgi:hypothetical protein